MTFDLLKMVLNSDENQRVVDFIFEDDTENLRMKRQGMGLEHRNLTKGEKILKIFGVPIDISYGEFIEK